MPKTAILSEMFLLAHQGGRPLPPWMQIGIGAFLWLIAAQLLYRFVRKRPPSGRELQRTNRGNCLPVAVVFIAMGYALLAPAFGWPRPAFGVQLVAHMISTIAIGVLCLFVWIAGRDVVKRLQAMNRAGELDIIPSLDSMLQRGERLIWTGIPNPAFYRSQAWAVFVFGFIPLAAGCGGMFLTGLSVLQDGLSPWLAIPLAATVGFTAIGVYSLLAPWRVRSMLKDSVYAITNQRGIVIRGTGIDGQGLPCRLKQTVYTFNAAQIAARRCIRSSRKRLDVVFGQEEQGQGQGRGGPRLIDVGFIACSEWEEAEAVLQKFYPKQESREVREELQGELAIVRPFSPDWFIQFLPYAFVFIPLVLFAGLLTLVGLSDIVAPRGVPRLWVCLPPGLIIFALLGGLAYYLFWNLPHRTILSFQCDGNMFSFVTKRDGQMSIPIDAVCSVTEDVSGRKSGRVLRGWWIKLQNAHSLYLARHTSQAASLVLFLQANPGIVPVESSATLLNSTVAF